MYYESYINKQKSVFSQQIYNNAKKYFLNSKFLRLVWHLLQRRFRWISADCRSLAENRAAEKVDAVAKHSREPRYTPSGTAKPKTCVLKKTFSKNTVVPPPHYTTQEMRWP